MKKFLKTTWVFALAVLLAGQQFGQTCYSQEATELDKAALDKSVNAGIKYLEGSQAEDGSWSGFAGIGPTALITTALLRNGRTKDDPTVAKAMAYLEKSIQDDGGIYKKGSRFKNYETCIVITCFAEANKDGSYDDAIAKADKFVKGVQWAEDEDIDKTDVKYGGGGYDKESRPDLSNTAFLVEALKSAGNDADSEAMQRALIFISRCQNLESEHNTTEFADKINDGSFYYSPIGDGASPAEKTDNGGLRGYGGMTYAGLKSMIYAGLGKDDPRVKAATEWMKKNYSVTKNPGMGDAGLFYYYQLFAKALDAMGEDTIVDSEGEKHNWKADLATQLAKIQKDNGSWVNANRRWMENDPNLATGFALLALSYCDEE